MRNLAGHPHATIYAAHELGGAGIPGEPCEPYGEPQATVLGVLGGFTFRRVWRYWVAEGRLPLEVAQRLYDDCYHIDTREALALFAQTLRALDAGLAGR